RYLRCRNQHFASHLHGLVEISLKFIDFDVDGNARRPRLSLCDSAIYAPPGPSVNQSVVHRIIGVHLPPEQFRIDLLEPSAIFPIYLKVHNWLSHNSLLSYPSINNPVSLTGSGLPFRDSRAVFKLPHSSLITHHFSTG